jgi:hypothetical protein
VGGCRIFEDINDRPDAVDDRFAIADIEKSSDSSVRRASSFQRADRVQSEAKGWHQSSQLSASPDGWSVSVRES